MAEVREVYLRKNFDASVEDPARAEAVFLREQESLVQLERALFILTASDAIDRMTTLEARITTFRARVNQEIAKLADAEKAVEAARQIDAGARTIANEILEEQFDTGNCSPLITVE